MLYKKEMRKKGADGISLNDVKYKWMQKHLIKNFKQLNWAKFGFGAFITSSAPTAAPSLSPSNIPTGWPTIPTFSPITNPTTTPTIVASAAPTTAVPTFTPSTNPTSSPTTRPTALPTITPTFSPSALPSQMPTISIADEKAPVAKPHMHTDDDELTHVAAPIPTKPPKGLTPLDKMLYKRHVQELRQLSKIHARKVAIGHGPSPCGTWCEDHSSASDKCACGVCGSHGGCSWSCDPAKASKTHRLVKCPVNATLLAQLQQSKVAQSALEVAQLALVELDSQPLQPTQSPTASPSHSYQKQTDTIQKEMRMAKLFSTFQSHPKGINTDAQTAASMAKTPEKSKDGLGVKVVSTTHKLKAKD
jgi:hypothetical protein